MDLPHFTQIKLVPQREPLTCHEHAIAALLGIDPDEVPRLHGRPLDERAWRWVEEKAGHTLVHQWFETPCRVADVPAPRGVACLAYGTPRATSTILPVGHHVCLLRPAGDGWETLDPAPGGEGLDLVFGVAWLVPHDMVSPTAVRGEPCIIGRAHPLWGAYRQLHALWVEANAPTVRAVAVGPGGVGGRGHHGALVSLSCGAGSVGNASTSGTAGSAGSSAWLPAIAGGASGACGIR